MSKEIKTKKDIAKAFIGALAALIILDLTPLGGKTVFYGTRLACSQRPVYTQKGAGMAQAGVPNYIQAPNLAS